MNESKTNQKANFKNFSSLFCSFRPSPRKNQSSRMEKSKKKSEKFADSLSNLASTSQDISVEENSSRSAPPPASLPRKQTRSSFFRNGGKLPLPNLKKSIISPKKGKKGSKSDGRSEQKPPKSRSMLEYGGSRQKLSPKIKLSQEPMPVIVVTDIGADIDDTLALFVMLGGVDAVKIVAVVTSAAASI